MATGTGCSAMHDRIEVAPGVTYTPCIWWDSYTGTDADMVRAGLVRPDQLPGAPGNGRTMVTFLANGERVRKGDSRSTRNAPGCIAVRRRTPRLLLVEIQISREAGEARRDAWLAARERAQSQGRCWPFPVCHGSPV